jgi:hypothetical protein
MDYRDYVARMLAHRAIADVQIFATVREGDEELPLLRVHVPGRRTLLVTAGFHGNEVAGPLTLVDHLPEIVERARTRGVALQIYPCLNPSGFVDGTRYNRGGEAPNNDFLRYEVAPGVWVGELAPGQGFLRHAVFEGGPRETRALRAELERAPPPDGALDIHQDPWLPGSVTYAYVFGPPDPFLPLVEASGRLLEVARSAQVDDDVHTDEHGLIVLHDGSVTDYFHRRGVPLAAALETTTAAPLPVCHAVNLVWLAGFVDAVADGPDGPGPR